MYSLFRYIFIYITLLGLFFSCGSGNGTSSLSSEEASQLSLNQVTGVASFETAVLNSSANNLSLAGVSGLAVRETKPLSNAVIEIYTIRNGLSLIHISEPTRPY